jgi:beta-galactosidase
MEKNTTFEGRATSSVFERVGEWAYGYSYFYFDVSQFIQEGDNTLAVKLSIKNLLRWYPGAGLYRNVSVIKNNKV